ncbi:MAG TPA: metallophosphoesterase family protein [Gaiellales bacterium]|jgi:predicted phosphodiesterase
MKVMALYDIHGNVDALDAVLADPRGASADLIVVGGDAIPGPFARETLARLAGLDLPVRWIRGNGEREVGEAIGRPMPEGDDMAPITDALTVSAIGDEQARVCAGAPLTAELDGVLYCHASPRRDDEMLTRLSTAVRYAAALADVELPVVVAGHTHQQDDRMVGGTRFVNAGSVGLPYEGDGDARWLWVEDGVPSLRQTAYDHVAAGERILAAGWPDEQSTRAALVEPMEAILITRLFEERTT